MTDLFDRHRRPLRDLRISVIDRCNFRCPYCMPVQRFGGPSAFLAKGDWLRPDEIERLARAFVQAGVRKLRLTGGEPLLRPELIEIVERLARIGGIDDLALTTNGVLLPKLAADLRRAGLMRLTISLDALDPARFRRMSGGQGEVADVLAGIAAAEVAGFERVKLNCVVQRGVNDDEVLSLLEHFRGTPHVVRFIEYMDVGNRNHWQPDTVVPSRELMERVHARWPISPVRADYRGEVAERYRFDDGGGEVGFISSVSQPFCGDCTRVRLSSEGSLYTCLFATHGTDLRAPLRAGEDDDALIERIRGVWGARADRYSELRQKLRNEQPLRKIEMNYIGG
jgi:cyclic pyranopterin phosphate synthase